LRAGFEAEHRRSYGHDLGAHRIDLVTLRVIGTIAPEGPATIAGVTGAATAAGAQATATTRGCWFGPGYGRIETPVIDRAALGETPRPGPLIIEEYEGTTVVPPDGAGRRDGAGNIVITLDPGAGHAA